MKEFFLIIFFYINVISVPKVQIQAPDVLKVLKQFDQYIQKEGFDKALSGKQQICLLVEQQNSNKIIYVTCANNMGWFVDEVPSSYSEYATRNVFVYSNKTTSGDNKVLFEDFYDQFSSALYKDYTREGQFIEESRTYEIWEIPVWRIVFSGGGKKIDFKRVSRFPKKSFYNKYQYDENGYLMGLDGIYKDGDQIMPHQREPKNFRMRKYMLATTSVPYDSLKQSNVTAEIIFNEKGCVEDSNITGITDVKLIHEIREALKKMPCWAPGTVGGKPVKVRTRYGL